MVDIRIVFTKLGMLRYISHLDLQRAVARLLIRSGLPIAYSEGFNPHPRLSIALPLSVYQEGENEVLDIKLDNDVPTDEIVRRLNERSFPGMEIKEAFVTEKKSSPSSAVYRIECNSDMPACELENAFAGEMTVLKKSKSKEEMTDIAPMIKLLSVGTNEGLTVIRVLLPASGGCYLNPSYIVSFFASALSNVRIVREKIIFS